jgi:hypothetical protein
LFDAHHPQFCCIQHIPVVKRLIKLFTPSILLHRYPNRKLLCPRHMRAELRLYSVHPMASVMTLPNIRDMYDGANIVGPDVAFGTVFPGIPIVDFELPPSSSDDDDY